MSKYTILKILAFVIMSFGALHSMGYASSNVYYFTIWPGLLLLLIVYVIEMKKDKKK